MISTLIEKVKGFLYIGDYSENEKPRFGIIRVLPYICLGDYEKTKERAILDSHHLRNYKYKILVRSEKAVSDITSILLRNDLKYKIRKEQVEKTRQWFSITEPNLLKYLEHDERSILVDVTEENLDKFIEIIKDLRKTHSYRNIYQGKDEIFYIV